MEDDFSFYNIFQDPLLTLVGVLLLSSLWTIIPDDSTPSINPEAYNIQKRIARIKEVVISVSKEIEDLRRKILQKQEEIIWVEEQIQKARREMNERMQEEGKLEGLIARLQSELSAREKEIERLEKILHDLREREKTYKVPPPVCLTEKPPFNFGVMNGRIYLLDKEHLDVFYSTQIVNGIIYYMPHKVKIGSSVQGEDIEQIKNPNGEFQAKLSSLDNKESCLIFWVHPDSIRTYKEGRDMALGRKFEVGWNSWTEDYLYLGSGKERQETYKIGE